METRTIGEEAAFTIDGFFTPDECRTLIAAAEARGFAGTGHLYPPSYRNNDRLMIDDEALAARIFERLRPSLPQVRDDKGRVLEAVGLNARFRFCRYSGGQRFSVHRDGAYCRPNGDASRLVCQIYLNDAAEFTGGHTRFFATQTDELPVFSVRPALGRAIVFDHQLWHDGEPVPTGTKYVLRADVMYRCEEPRAYLWRVAYDGALNTASRDGTIRRDGAIARGPGGSIGAMAVTERGVFGATRSGVIFRANFATGGYDELARVDNAVIDLIATRDDLIVSCADGTLRTASGLARRAHTSWAAAIVYLPRRDLIASVGYDGALVLSRAADLSELVLYEHGTPLTSVTASDFMLWIGDQAGRVTTVSLACDDLRRAQSTLVHDGAVTAIARRGTRLATGSEDFTVRVNGEIVTRHTDFVRSIAWIDDDTCVSVGYDGVVRRTELRSA